MTARNKSAKSFGKRTAPLSTNEFKYRLTIAIRAAVAANDHNEVRRLENKLSVNY